MTDASQSSTQYVQRLPSPGIAVLLNVFWPGAGNVYGGQLLLGLAWMFLAVPAIAGLTIIFGLGSGGLGLFVGPPLWMLSFAFASTLAVDRIGRLAGREPLLGTLLPSWTATLAWFLVGLGVGYVTLEPVGPLFSVGITLLICGMTMRLALRRPQTAPDAMRTSSTPIRLWTALAVGGWTATVIAHPTLAALAAILTLAVQIVNAEGRAAASAQNRRVRPARADR